MSEQKPVLIALGDPDAATCVDDACLIPETNLLVEEIAAGDRLDELAG